MKVNEIKKELGHADSNYEYSTTTNVKVPVGRYHVVLAGPADPFKLNGNTIEADILAFVPAGDATEPMPLKDFDADLFARVPHASVGFVGATKEAQQKNECNKVWLVEKTETPPDMTEMANAQKENRAPRSKKIYTLLK